MLPKRYLKERFSQGKKPTGDDFAKLIDGVPRHREVFTTKENQTEFNLSNRYTPERNQIEVVVGGVPQFSPENFTETSTTSITMNESLPAGIEVVVSYYE